ncbi:hypothetical protein [Hymenobacter metallilatus]|uniref:Uncharacterized protein n=1 Tax=Hymenobacter metallilatus TaxID=2493666 RepID=A0A428IZ00_9BACT|nr:hypothetical protein [Hymenobacter metallilatus]RSK24185.1 hypothetical protein EI290_20610 [Hymenobacter metallilatus]
MTELHFKGNCLLFAVLYRLANPGSRIKWHRGRWWRWAPHFCVLHNDNVVDFKSEPHRNNTPLWFRGRMRVRSKDAYQAYISR